MLVLYEVEGENSSQIDLVFDCLLDCRTKKHLRRVNLPFALQTNRLDGHRFSHMQYFVSELWKRQTVTKATAAP